MINKLRGRGISTGAKVLNKTGKNLASIEEVYHALNNDMENQPPPRTNRLRPPVRNSNSNTN